MTSQVELVAMDGSIAARVDVPPWEHPLDAVLWAGRLFLRDACNYYRFREGVLFYATTTELLALKRATGSSRCLGHGLPRSLARPDPNA